MFARVAVENLENRLLLSTVSVADFGARPDDGRDDRAAIQTAIDASEPGDEITFKKGTYESHGALTFTSERSYAATRGTEINFRKTKFGIHLEAAAHDILITRFTFNGAGIVMGEAGGRTYRNINVVGNAFHDIGTNAIKATVGSDYLTIDGNEFVNVQGYGVFEVYSANHFTYTYNHVVDSAHGGHLLGPLDDNVLAHNYMTGLTDWGLEIQRIGGSVSHDLRVEDNVIFGYRRAYGNSGGLSVMAEHGQNTIVLGNYVRADHDGVPLEEGHMHVGIEAAFDSGIVEHNILGGDNEQGNFTHYITASGPKMLFKDNLFFGVPQWNSETARWPGNVSGGRGTFREQDNSRQHKFERMPKPPRRTKDTNLLSWPPTEGFRAFVSAKPPDGWTWLSDIRWRSAANGWGPAETDRSNGERRARDGGMLSIDRQGYAKGIGVAINSQIVYDLGGKYSDFFSDIGIDDQAGNRGSVTFEVWADGHKIFASGKLTHADGAKSVSLDVIGVKQLKLITTDAGDGGNSDHADWASARLKRANA